jgi:hypothetical protein
MQAKKKKEKLDGFGIAKGANSFNRKGIVFSCFIEKCLDKKKRVKKCSSMTH